MRLRCAIIAATILGAAAPAAAQWQYLGPPGTFDHTDVAVRSGVIVVSMSGSAGSSGLLRSADGGATWAVPTQTPSSGTPRAFTESVRSVVARPSGFLADMRHRADAAGQDWQRALSPAPGTEGFNVYRYHYETRTRQTLYATNYAPPFRGAALARSLDDGETWTAMTGPFTRLSFVHARGDTLLAGLAVGGAWLSTDAGATWVDLATRGVVGAGVGGFAGPDGSLYVNLAVGNFLGRTELWRSRDRGQTWTKLTDSVTPVPPDTPNSRNGIVYAEGPKILFSAACQVYLSQDDGATWTARSESLPACTASGSSTGGISQMAIDGGFLYVLRQQFLSGNRPDWGLYRRPLSDLGLAGATAAAEGAAPPAGVALSLAPNPAAAATRLSVSLDAPQHLRVTIVDVLGRDVLTVADGLFPLGQREHTVVTSSLPPGVYVVRVIGATVRASQRLTVVR